MRHSSRFWGFLLGAFLLDSVLAECQKLQTFANETSSLRRKRSMSENEVLKFATGLAIEAANVALGSIPLVGTIATFMVGTLIDGLWPENTDESLRAKFIEDIHKEMNYQSIERMKMKIRDYGRQLSGLFDLIHMPPNLLEEWQNSVVKSGLGVAKQRTQLESLKQRVSGAVFEVFKDKLLAITADIQNDRNNFLIPNNPATSLAYYREFATLEIVLLTTELLINVEDHASAHVRLYNEKAIKSAAETHYHFVHWAAHKSASVIEAKTRDWRKYDESVESVLGQFPLKEWRELSNFQEGDSIFIRNDDAVSLKSVASYFTYGGYGEFSYKILEKSSEYYGWMSCWGAGSWCKTRHCPGEHNPFDAGARHKYYYKCRGEVFWIYADGRYPNKYVKSCDEVALMYKYDYWLGLGYNFWGSKLYKTNTCPGRTFFNSKFNGRCSWEVFTVKAEGRSCGDKVQDRDVLTLRHKFGFVSGGQNPMHPSAVPHQWRIFKHDSFLSSSHH